MQKPLCFFLAILLVACGGGERSAERENRPAASSSAPSTLATAEPKAAKTGAQLYRLCRTCHQIDDSGRHRVGPNLLGLFGAQAGKKDGFRYSPTMEQSGIIWNEETLDEFIKNPRSYMPGNRMGFAGMKSDAERAVLIEYLRKRTQISP